MLIQTYPYTRVYPTVCIFFCLQWSDMSVSSLPSTQHHVHQHGSVSPWLSEGKCYLQDLDLGFLVMTYYLRLSVLHLPADLEQPSTLMVPTQHSLAPSLLASFQVHDSLTDLDSVDPLYHPLQTSRVDLSLDFCRCAIHKARSYRKVLLRDLVHC